MRGALEFGRLVNDSAMWTYRPVGLMQAFKVGPRRLFVVENPVG
jgi:hypothetical protein